MENRNKLFISFSFGQKFSSRKEANIHAQTRILTEQVVALKKAAAPFNPIFTDTIHERRYYYLGDNKVK